MSRVNDLNHLGRSDLLRICWFVIPQFFALLPPAAQWEVHRLYDPSLNLDDELVLARIKAAHASDPSLAQRVGKHYKVIFTRYKLYADQVSKANFAAIRLLLRRDILFLACKPEFVEGVGRKPQYVGIYAIVKPEIEMEKLSRALLMLVQRSNGPASAI